MSCTIVAVPYALAWVVGSLIASTAVSTVNKTRDIITEYYEQEAELYKNQTASANNSDCDDVEVITDKHFIEKEFETPFADKELLIKTLEEHGCADITCDEIGSISCNVDNYSLSFYKNISDGPYKLRISALETDNTEEKVGDLHSEYALNVQEDAYLQIINKLKENNMQIESEEVQDDNTIVLTINLE